MGLSSEHGRRQMEAFCNVATIAPTDRFRKLFFYPFVHYFMCADFKWFRTYFSVVFFFFQLFVVVSSLLVAGCSGQLRDPKSIPDDESRTRVCEEGEGLDQTTPAPDALPALARGSLNPAANAGAFRQVPKPPVNLRVFILS